MAEAERCVLSTRLDSNKVRCPDLYLPGQVSVSLRPVQLNTPNLIQDTDAAPEASTAMPFKRDVYAVSVVL
jgi:hypothetical protein